MPASMLVKGARFNDEISSVEGQRSFRQRPPSPSPSSTPPQSLAPSSQQSNNISNLSINSTSNSMSNAMLNAQAAVANAKALAAQTEANFAANAAVTAAITASKLMADDQHNKPKEKYWKNPSWVVGGPAAAVATSEDMVVIHVCDENRQITKDFCCKRNILVKHMRYFERFLAENENGYDDIDISVHCDVEIFEWLMTYIHEPDLPPSLDKSIVVSILISSEFLQMDALVDVCLEHIAASLGEIIKLPIDLTCISDKLVNRLAVLTHPKVINRIDIYYTIHHSACALLFTITSIYSLRTLYSTCPTPPHHPSSHSSRPSPRRKTVRIRY